MASNWPGLEHFDELVFTNIDGGTLFGAVVPKAQWFHPETLTFWLKVGDSHQQITHAQAFVQRLYLHYKYDIPVEDWRSEALDLIGLSHDYNITFDAMRVAVLDMPWVVDLIRSIGLNDDEVWAYTQAEAPWAVALAGVASPAPLA